MRALQVVYGLGIGGVERTAQNCAIATHQMGYDTTVMALTGGPRVRALEEAGIRVVVGSENVDLPQQDFIGLHSHGLPSDMVDSLLTSQPDALVCEKNVFSTPSPWMSRLTMSFQLSPWAHWLYGKRGGDLGKSSTLCNPLDPTSYWNDSETASQFRHRHGIPSEALVLGRVGQPLSMKWSPRVYSAVCDEITGDPVAHLLVIGAPRDIVTLVSSRLARSQYTVIDKIVDDDELRAAYSAMDLFVHAARQGESFGNVIAEAALCEVPTLTIATPWADNSQGYVAGPTGFVASSVKEYRRLLREALQDRDRLVARGQGARDFTLGNFSAINSMEEAMGIMQGLRPRRQAPSTHDLRTARFLGEAAGKGVESLALGAGSYVLGPLTGQETWTWAATKRLNSWGISRHGWRRA